MFGSVVQSDLSKTYYTEGNVPYERLNNYGVVLHARLFSNRSIMTAGTYPTIGMNYFTSPGVTRKIKELYPAFENDLKENVLDYARMIRSPGRRRAVDVECKVDPVRGLRYS